MTLVQLGYFGDPAGDLKGILLDAWDDNRAWCKEKRLLLLRDDLLQI